MKKVSFIKMLKEFGVGRVLISWDLIFSFFITLAIVISVYRGYIHVNHGIYGSLISASATLFGLLFTAFAIVISLSDSQFIKLLRDKNLFNNIIFPFWHVSILYLLSIIFDCLTMIFCEQIKTLYHLVAGLAIFFTLYSLFATFYRISATVKLGIYRSLLIDMLEKKKEETPS